MSKVLIFVSFLLVGMMDSGDCQTSGGTCLYRDTEDGYICELLLGSYLKEGDQFNIADIHLTGHTDEHVVGLIASTSHPSNLRLIPPIIFTKFINLKRLQLSSVGLESIAGLQNCLQLQAVDLDYNSILNITEGGFEACANLQVIRLRSNELSEIRIEAFRGLPQLHSLHLDSNQISSIYPGSFAGLRSLLHLTLTDNQMVYVPPNVFHDLEHLEDIDLSSNSIALVQSDSFKNLTALRLLLINDNLISEIEANAFNSLASIDTLLLSNNSISSLSTDSFLNMTTLRRLSISGNQVTSIQRNFFENFPNLQILNAEGNECINGQFFPGTDIDFLNTLDRCFQNYENSDGTTPQYITITDDAASVISQLRLTVGLTALCVFIGKLSSY